MKKELIDSSVDRKNILNNSFAIAELQGQLGIGGVLFEGEYRYTTQQVADSSAVWFGLRGISWGMGAEDDEQNT